MAWLVGGLMDFKLFGAIIEHVTGIELIVIITILSLTYLFYHRNNKKREDRQDELNTSVLKVLTELKSQMSILANRYSDSVNLTQAKMILSLIFKNALGSFIEEARDVKERNNIKVNRDTIIKNMKQYIDTKYDNDKGSLSIYKHNDRLLSDCMDTSWLGRVEEIIFGYIIEDSYTYTQFRSALRTLFRHFEQESYNTVSNNTINRDSFGE